MKENMLCIYKPINDHIVVAPAAAPFTIRCICLQGSLENQVDNCMPQRILWNQIRVPKRESRPANAQMNAVSIKHLLVALNRTKFEHNSKRTIDHGSILVRAGHRLIGVVQSTFCMPLKKRGKQKNDKNSKQITAHFSKHFTRNACFNPPLSAMFSL